jgi:hypothetical protein
MNMQEQGFYDIYGMWHVPFWQKSWFLWSGIGLGVSLLSFITWYLVKKYRARKKVDLPYWQEALNQLVTLKQRNIANVEQGSLFYTHLTAILKHYIQLRYGFDVRGKTDAETIAVLERAQFDPSKLNQLKPILQGSLYVKFANAQAVQQQIEKDLQDTVDFIKKNMPS